MSRKMNHKLQENDPMSGHFLRLKIPLQAKKPNTGNDFVVLNGERGRGSALRMMALEDVGGSMLKTRLPSCGHRKLSVDLTDATVPAGHLIRSRGILEARYFS
jgi:hypothetical protein